MAGYELPECPESLPDEVERSLGQLAEAWAKTEVRPRIHAATLAHWDRLLDEWALEHDLPLFIRKWGRDLARGQTVRHSTGRSLVPSDNTLAHWAFVRAYQGECPTIGDVRGYVARRELPVAMALKTSELPLADYRKLRGRSDNLNKLGWRVCHRVPVGMRKPGKLSALPIDDLMLHFKRFLAPSNMFLVPKLFGGMGGLPTMLEVMRRHN